MPKRMSSSAKVRMQKPLLRTAEFRTVKPPPKVADAELQTAAHRQWAAQVLRIAGRRCEALDKGGRCQNKWPEHRMYADHKVERRDGGAALDIRNGQCLCPKHHTAKTIRERTARMAERSV